MKKPEIEDLLILSVDAIKDFQTCARLYDYRHKQKSYEPIYKRDLLAMRYENTIKRIVSFYFYKKQAGIIPSYSALLNRWERLWFPKDTTAYDLATDQHDVVAGNLVRYSNDAAAALLKFYEDFENDPGIPLLIDEEFIYLVRREIRLQGRFDLVLRTGNQYKVIKWSSKSRRPGLGNLLLDFAALKAAYDKRNEDKVLNVQYGLYDLCSGKPGFVEVEVKPEDISALTFWATSAYEEKIFPSRRGLTSYCKVCPHDDACKKWQEWPDQ